MIIDQYKAIFIHIPKNAGTSIEKYFVNGSVRIQPEKHADIYEIKKKFKNSYNSKLFIIFISIKKFFFNRVYIIVFIWLYSK